MLGTLLRFLDSRLFREALVPVIMLCFTLAYIVQVTGLSTEALVFPVGLMIVLAVSLLIAFAGLILKPHSVKNDEEDAGPILGLRPVTLAIGSVALVAAFDYLGTFLALTLLVIGAQWALGARSPWRTILLALVLVGPTYFLFKYVFYVRFPVGVLGIG